MFSAINLKKEHAKGTPVLEGVSFSLEKEQTLAVVGPSGCGKTTLLYMLCGLSRPSDGSVTLDGVPVVGTTPDISIILQDYGLLPWKSILDNVALGLRLQGVGRKERDARAREQLAELGIVGRDTDFPGSLSGGEQQRVAIARAFVSRPRVMLLDEPFSSLDAMTREKLQEILLDVWQRRKVPYVLVTHSLEEAVFLGKRILVLAGRPARPAVCFDNPAFGTGRRDSEAFLGMLQELRRTVESLWQE